jgi:hypothetical protein
MAKKRTNPGLTRSHGKNSSIAPFVQNRKKRTGQKPSAAANRVPLQFEWASTIEPEQWDVYRSAISALKAANVPILLGGGFALAIYSGRWRNTKDIDFYIRKLHRKAAVEALTRAGFTDYFSKLPYDRKWIYRSTRDGVIVDMIWAMANQRAQVDECWFRDAPAISIRNESLSLVPIEEYMWCKLYILQRDHCDWTDIMNVLYASGEHVNWNHVLDRLEEDWPLLKALLTVYGWICPGRARDLPLVLRRRLKLDPPLLPRRSRFNRIRLLDSRDWFAGLLEKDKPLQV